MSSLKYQLDMLRSAAITSIGLYIVRNGPTTINNEREGIEYKIRVDAPYVVINEASATLLGADALAMIADLLNAATRNEVAKAPLKHTTIPNIRLPYADDKE